MRGVIRSVNANEEWQLAGYQQGYPTEDFIKDSIATRAWQWYTANKRLVVFETKILFFSVVKVRVEDLTWLFRVLFGEPPATI